MFNSYNWKDVITFKDFVNSAVKNGMAYLLPDHYEIMDKDCLGIVDDKGVFIPLRFSKKSVRDVLKKKLLKTGKIK